MFAERGFHGVSMDDLGTELGVSGPALYRHFPSKEAILSAMLISISERLLAGAQHCLTSSVDAPAQLDSLIAFHVEFALTEPDLIAVQFRDLANVPEPGRRAVRQLQRLYVEAWVGVLMEIYPEIGHDRAQAVAQAVFGLLNSTSHSRSRAGSEPADLLHRMAAAALAEGCQND